MFSVAKKSMERVPFYFLLRSFFPLERYKEETQIKDLGRIADEW